MTEHPKEMRPVDMTFRDYVAIRMIAGLLTYYGADREFNVLVKDGYRIADALIKERNK